LSNVFVLNRLRAKPVAYEVRLEHFVADGEWMFSVAVRDIVEDAENKKRIVADLRRAADMLEESMECPSTPNSAPTSST
jgi:truncated hemoglobin YjbI